MNKDRAPTNWSWREGWPRAAALFYLYSFLGWCLEALFEYFVKHEGITNPGFLTGPACPIYAFGMLAMVWLLNGYIRPASETGKPWYVRVGMTFLISVLIATLLELVVGYVLFVCFQTRLWDYSRELWNLNGYICPLFSFLWGVGGVVALLVIHPLLDGLVGRVPPGRLKTVDAVLGVVLAIDLICSVLKLFALG